jgi:uncharacterized protein YjiS (DUF1127 family)
MLTIHTNLHRLDLVRIDTPRDWINRVSLSFARWRRRRKAIADLHALSDRLLADIGIKRSEIEAVVHAGGRDVSRRGR